MGPPELSHIDRLLKVTGVQGSPRWLKIGAVVLASVGVTVVVEGCTNLVSPVWLPLTTNILFNGTIYFDDPQWTNYRARFYQAETH